MHKDISTKFGVNPRDGFRENSFNGRTEGYQPRQQHYYAVTQGRTINWKFLNTKKKFLCKQNF